MEVHSLWGHKGVLAQRFPTTSLVPVKLDMAKVSLLERNTRGFANN